jgi:hypothetical protein
MKKGAAVWNRRMRVYRTVGGGVILGSTKAESIENKKRQAQNALEAVFARFIQVSQVS